MAVVDGMGEVGPVSGVEVLLLLSEVGGEVASQGRSDDDEGNAGDSCWARGSLISAGLDVSRNPEVDCGTSVIIRVHILALILILTLASLILITPIPSSLSTCSNLARRLMHRGPR